MADKLPFTIEILGFEDERLVVIDRVIGGSVYFEEAKRIGQHLLSIVDAGIRPHGIASSAIITSQFTLGGPVMAAKPRCQ